MKNHKTSVIIVAAGNSTRMGGVSKQLIMLNDKETICHTILAFQKCDYVNEIIIVCKDDDKIKFEELVKKYCYTKVIGYAVGGDLRSQSVENGLNLISEDCDYIAIHDGARPLVTTEEIESVLKNAYKYKASALGVNVKDTIKVVSKDGIIESTPNRNTLIAIHTPQVFEKQMYIEAVKNAKNSKKEFTDDCSIVEDYGKDIFVTIGSYENIKITTPEDVDIAVSILKKRNKLIEKG